MNLAFVLLAMIAALALGIWVAAILDATCRSLVAGRGRMSLTAPLHAAAAHLSRQHLTTEAPDRMNWFLSIASYLALAAIGLAMVPLGPDTAVIGISTSVVLWGACESLVIVVVFLHGWSPNSPLALIGAYRYVAIGLPVMLLSMFVLIAAALPAQSLDLREIVTSQAGMWNVIRQPLGLPLFLLLGLSLTLRGPFDYADSADLAGGTSVEESGADRAGWQVARLAMLVGFSAIAATVFLGGYLGPVLPGAVWLILKSLAVMAVVIAGSHLLARMPAARMLGLIWKVLLPLAFVDLLWAGLGALS
ncbi:MAG: NADH-quinone oxidoreductase subunit H [Allgaiera sp.]|jgi:NADH-quinone oxidoreductase subunit H|nr:NADH-quinone oxidoreductase subunit H [Allgaiera sp.]